MIMKSLKNMPESLETITYSVRPRPLLWKFLITGAIFWFVFCFFEKHKHAFSLVENCRYKVKSCDCLVPYKETKMTQAFTSE